MVFIQLCAAHCRFTKVAPFLRWESTLHHLKKSERFREVRGSERRDDNGAKLNLDVILLTEINEGKGRNKSKEGLDNMK